VKRLREDPLTDFVPVVALVPTGQTIDPVAVRQLGADDVLSKPFEPADLESTIGRLTGTVEGRGQVAGLAGEHTVDAIASRIADEVRRGLVDSVDRGRDLPIPLGDGTEVLAAAWQVISRLRAHLATRSGGRVHFHDTAAGGPAFLALAPDEIVESRSTPVSLRDRHVIVCDDDPAVVWFFSGLLREEGAIVEESADGQEALSLARRKRPDVVVSDILMPRLDGFGLTRELKRDPALSDVPVILLSWKEDFLQRMRELQSGASGYLRKEAPAVQILDAVRECLRPRARLEAQLRAGGDVRGRLERIGIIPLIKTVAVHRPNARVSVRDAWNLFEIDVRADGPGGGRIVDITRTASDGSFSRGPKVVVPLLGVTAGRFAVADAESAVRGSIKEPLDVVLKKGAAQIGALVDAVSGKGLALAAKVELDEDILSPLLRASPEPMRLLVDELLGGRGPRALLLAGAASPQELESVLLDLARQGAVLAVKAENGEDRIAAAARSRGEIELPTRMPSVAPGMYAPSDRGTAAASEVDPHAETQIKRPISKIPTLDPPKLPPGAPEELEPELSYVDSIEDDLGGGDELEAPGPAPQGDFDEAPTTQARPGKIVPMDEVPTAIARPAKLVDQLDEPMRDPSPRAAPPVEKTGEITAAELDAAETWPAEPPRKPAPPAPRPAPAATDATTRRVIDPGFERLGWAFVLVLLAIAGFVGYRQIFGSGDAPERPIEDGRIGTPTPPPDERGEPEAPEGEGAERPASPESPAPTPPPEEPGVPSLSSYGREAPTIEDTHGAMVTSGQGLVVLEPAADGSEVRVRIDGSEHVVRATPIGLAMTPGVHQVAFVRGDDLSFRFIRVQEGHTRFVPPP
jgi:CheY-like chemotaxis protein